MSISDNNWSGDVTLMQSPSPNLFLYCYTGPLHSEKKLNQMSELANLMDVEGGYRTVENFLKKLNQTEEHSQAKTL